jgi:hypothetical protein
VLRDAYVFAGPAVGDKDFASAFNGNFNKAFEENRMLWRIVNTNDIVTKMPPQHLYRLLRRYITKDDILNYYGIGYKINFFLNNNKPKGVILREKNKDVEEKGDNLKSMENLLRKKLDDDKKDYEESKITLNNILNIILGRHSIDSYYNYDNNHSPDDVRMDKIETYMPGFIHNHFPHRYFMVMERLRSDEFELEVGNYKDVIDKVLTDVNVMI